MVGTSGSPPWVIGSIKGHLGNMRLLLSVPLVNAGYSNDQAALAAYAANPATWDSNFKILAQNLVADGFSNAVIRLMWEPDSGIYSSDDLTSAANYAALWRDAYTAMASVSGANFQWAWYWGANFDAVTNATAYPGNSYVNYVTFDFYDQSWDGSCSIPYNGSNFTAAQESCLWSGDFDGVLSGLASFASAHGKPIGIGEFGVVDRSDGHGGGDDPTFLNRFSAWMKLEQRGLGFLLQLQQRWERDPRRLPELARGVQGGTGLIGDVPRYREVVGTMRDRWSAPSPVVTIRPRGTARTRAHLGVVARLEQVGRRALQNSAGRRSGIRRPPGPNLCEVGGKGVPLVLQRPDEALHRVRIDPARKRSVDAPARRAAAALRRGQVPPSGGSGGATGIGRPRRSRCARPALRRRTGSAPSGAGDRPPGGCRPAGGEARTGARAQCGSSTAPIGGTRPARRTGSRRRTGPPGHGPDHDRAITGLDPPSSGVAPARWRVGRLGPGERSDAPRARASLPRGSVLREPCTLAVVGWPSRGGFKHLRHTGLPGVLPPKSAETSASKGNCAAVVSPSPGIVTFGSVLSTEFPGMMIAAAWRPRIEGFVGNGRGSK